MKTPAPQKMSSGNWFIRLRLGGENVNITAPTKKACTQQAQFIKAEYLAGKREAKNAAPTLGEAIDKYIDARVGIRSPSTIRGYRYIRRNRFQKYMNADIDKIDWQRMVREEAEIVSPKTIRNSWGLVVSVLAQNRVFPDKISLPTVVVKERPWLNSNQIRVFLRAIKGTSVEIPALLDLHSLRRSEMLALTWEKNIDLKKGIIKVAGSIVSDEYEKFVYKEANKNQPSRRVIPIFIPQLREALMSVEKKSGPVVTSNPATIYKHINKICRENDLPKVGNHGLRRSFASACYEAGLSERDCMAIGGWSDIQTMHKIYIKVSEDRLQKAASILTEKFKEPKTSTKTSSGSKKHSI